MSAVASGVVADALVAENVFFYLIAVMLHAYAVHDRVLPPKEDEGEEY